MFIEKFLIHWLSKRAKISGSYLMIYPLNEEEGIKLYDLPNKPEQETPTEYPVD